MNKNFFTHWTDKIKLIYIPLFINNIFLIYIIIYILIILISFSIWLLCSLFDFLWVVNQIVMLELDKNTFFNLEFFEEKINIDKYWPFYPKNKMVVSIINELKDSGDDGKSIVNYKIDNLINIKTNIILKDSNYEIVKSYFNEVTKVLQVNNFKSEYYNLKIKLSILPNTEFKHSLNYLNKYYNSNFICNNSYSIILQNLLVKDLPNITMYEYVQTISLFNNKPLFVSDTLDIDIDLGTRINCKNQMFITTTENHYRNCPTFLVNGNNKNIPCTMDVEEALSNIQNAVTKNCKPIFWDYSKELENKIDIMKHETKEYESYKKDLNTTLHIIHNITNKTTISISPDKNIWKELHQEFEHLNNIIHMQEKKINDLKQMNEHLNKTICDCTKSIVSLQEELFGYDKTFHPPYLNKDKFKLLELTNHLSDLAHACKGHYEELNSNQIIITDLQKKLDWRTSVVIEQYKKISDLEQNIKSLEDSIFITKRDKEELD